MNTVKYSKKRQADSTNSRPSVSLRMRNYKPAKSASTSCALKKMRLKKALNSPLDGAMILMSVARNSIVRLANSNSSRKNSPNRPEKVYGTRKTKSLTSLLLTASFKKKVMPFAKQRNTCVF